MKIKVTKTETGFEVTDDKGRKIDGVVAVTASQDAGEPMIATVVIKVVDPFKNG